jgi:hypothetical protein
MIKYISNGDWFDKGTEVKLIDDYRKDRQSPGNIGLFYGWKTCTNPKSENRKLGERYMDEEVCNFDEFEVKNEKPKRTNTL